MTEIFWLVACVALLIIAGRSIWKRYRETTVVTDSLSSMLLSHDLTSYTIFGSKWKRRCMLTPVDACNDPKLNRFKKPQILRGAKRLARYVMAGHRTFEVVPTRPGAIVVGTIVRLRQ